MKKISCAILIIILFILPGRLSARAISESTAIRFGRLWDGTKMRQDAVVIVKHDRIVKVGTGKSFIPRGAKVIDLSGYTGIPGLIDVHTHMTYYWDGKPGTEPWSQLASRPSAMTLFLARENARKTLEAGVTTVRDLYAEDHLDIQMRDLINSGAMKGPRMLVCGYGLYITYEAAKPGVIKPRGGRADGVGEVIRLARQQIAAGADWIKMFGSTGSADDLTGYQTFTFEEMKAAAAVAHQAGKRIAIHSYGPQGARDAVRAGADSIEHPVDLDVDTIKEMKKRGTFYVPTIDHNRYYADHHKEFRYGPEKVKALRAFVKRNLKTLQKAHKAGVRIAMGSDALFTMLGENIRELKWFVKAGMSPTEALAAATTNGAILLGMENSIGKIEPGFYADIVAVDGNPLKDINCVTDGVLWVMKGGKVVVDKTKRRKQ